MLMSINATARMDGTFWGHKKEVMHLWSRDMTEQRGDTVTLILCFAAYLCIRICIL